MIRNVSERMVMGRLVPIEDKPCLNGVYRRALKSEVRIAPVAEFRIQAEIFISDVKAADIAGFAVNDDELAVIPIIEPQINRTKPGRKKDFHMAAGVPQRFEEFF